MAARKGRRHRQRGIAAGRVDVALDLLNEVDAEGAARGLACGPMADRVVALGLQALRAAEGHLAVKTPTQGALMNV